MEYSLEVKNVSKTYGSSTFSLKNISFSIPYGSIVGFIGENGAGKTTTMGTILGTLKKDSGSVYVLGEKMDRSSKDIKEDIGVVFDHINFSQSLHVTQLSNVMQHIYRQWNQERFFDYVDRFSLPKKEKIQGFSRGMSMKLSVAVALSHDAKLLILDEATAGLDPVAREELLDVLSVFVEDGERSILLSSHITSDIEKIADDLLFLKQGKLILKVSKGDLLNHYSVIQCRPKDINELDQSKIIAYQQQEEMMDVLIKSYGVLPPTFRKKDFSLDDITLLLMRGVIS